jgi:hypothetical protein
MSTDNEKLSPLIDGIISVIAEENDLAKDADPAKVPEIYGTVDTEDEEDEESPVGNEIGNNFVINKTVWHPDVIDDTDLFFTPPAGMENRFFYTYEIDVATPTAAETKRELLERTTLDTAEPTQTERRAVLTLMESTIKGFRKLLVNDLAPVMLSLDQAYAESTQVLKTITKTDAFSIDESGVRQIVGNAMRLKLIEHVSDLLKLDETHHQLLVSMAFGKQPTLHEIIKDALKNGKLS